MFLRHVLLNVKSTIRLSPQTIDRLIHRSLASHAKHSNSQKVSLEDKNSETDGKTVQPIIETKGARKEREKADFERLSVVERITKKYLPSHLNSIVIFAIVGIGYVIYEQVKNDFEIKYTFRFGSCPNFKFPEDQLLERKELLDTLTSIVTPVPDKLVSSYYIVVGDHGTGKTTLIRQAARKAGGGVIYVDVPSNVEKFGASFARAIRFNFKEHLRLSTWIESKMFGSPPDEGKEASWERVLLSFRKYAHHYRKKHGRVPVLIFDNCDSLAKKDQKMLEALQDSAKIAIDDSQWITVFVASIGETPEQMEGRSSITRASSFIQITDLSEEEAMTYLTEKRHLSKDLAHDMSALYGGRLKSLQKAATKIDHGLSFSDIRTANLNDIRRRLEKIRCRATTQEEVFIFNVLCGLLHKSELTVDELIHMEEDVSIRQKVLEELCHETILTRTVSSGSYIFQGQSAKVCVEEFYKEKKCFRCKSIKDMLF
ncbi:unnamed protein product [Adineta steineri]|uniref:AAA+ ATPase domain-containing protein n=1 Tax=Adineta steineri TaxID=433720 RepID=A0A819NQ09_9BILA|nr:unnamed protein product [Adineta steineri]CAF4000372.1 unnamed protein product [Adineta steineri]